MHRFVRTMVAVGALLASATASQASILTYTFFGKFDNALAHGNNATLQSLVGLGFTATFSYDTTVPDTGFSAGDPNFGDYPQSQPFNIHTSVIDFAFTLSVIQTNNDIGFPVFDVLSPQTHVRADNFSAFISLQDTSETALADDSLPHPFPPLSAFTKRILGINYVPTGGDVSIPPNAQLIGEITRAALVSEIEVPEPTALSLFAAGLLGLGALRRRLG